jgi:hypothetical protein
MILMHKLKTSRETGRFFIAGSVPLVPDMLHNSIMMNLPVTILQGTGRPVFFEQIPLYLKGQSCRLPGPV